MYSNKILIGVLLSVAFVGGFRRWLLSGAFVGGFCRSLVSVSFAGGFCRCLVCLFTVRGHCAFYGEERRSRIRIPGILLESWEAHWNFQNPIGILLESY